MSPSKTSIFTDQVRRPSWIFNIVGVLFNLIIRVITFNYFLLIFTNTLLCMYCHSFISFSLFTETKNEKLKTKRIYKNRFFLIVLNSIILISLFPVAFFLYKRQRSHASTLRERLLPAHRLQESFRWSETSTNYALPPHITPISLKNTAPHYPERRQRPHRVN